MRQLYSAFYFLIFLWFLRELTQVVCPDPNAKKYCLYLNLPHYSKSIRLATSSSSVLLGKARNALIHDHWNEDFLEITEFEPRFNPVNLESNEIFNIYDHYTVREIRDIVRKFVPTTNM